MKVYVIERGWYSDKHISGVVETEEEAKQICDTINSSNSEYHNDARYMEFDTKQFLINKLRWVVEFFAGEWEVHCGDDYYGYGNDSGESHEVFDGQYVVYADDKDTALKIAQDIRAEKMAERKEIKL